jgi:uncharacterized membrane protein YfcA
MPHELVAGAVAVVAGAVAAVSGFGIGSLLTPLLMLSMPATEAVALVAIPHAVATAVRWVRLRSDVHGPTFREFGLASALGGVGGAAWQSRLASPTLVLVLGVLLLVAAGRELARRPIALPQTGIWRLVGGALSGFFGGLVGNQGGIRAAALLGFGLRPCQVVATATATALLVDAARVPIYLLSAAPTVASGLRLVMVMTGGVILGTFLGVPVLGKIPSSIYRRVIGILLLLLGLGLLGSAVLGRPGFAA